MTENFFNLQKRYVVFTFAKFCLNLFLNEIRNYNLNSKLISIIITLYKVLSDFTLVVMCCNVDHTFFLLIRFY